MSLNETPSANRIHIGFFGKINSGKSSLINAVCGQQLAVVSDVPGTTTDPVTKAMELLPVGPVVLIDTAGIDDTSELGKLRVEKTGRMLERTDMAVLVVDGSREVTEEEKEFIRKFKQRKIPFLVAVNKEDLISPQKKKQWQDCFGADACIFVSAKENMHIEELKVSIGQLCKTNVQERPLVSDLVKKGDTVLLVMPIDASAPKGRLILPQQQVIRELLESGALIMSVQPEQLSQALATCTPGLVITDSQVFGRVSAQVPEDIPLTSFSILFARYKGTLWDAVAGARVLDCIADGDAILIAEGCTHHRQCGDIGRDKLPAWIRKHTGKEPVFHFGSGAEFQEDLTGYRLVVHCGGCVLNEKEMQHRLALAKEQGVPMTNYGIAIAHMNGILERSIEIYES
ncbi:MAG: [Lachnospiraceae bacterium]|nr:[FeFe] hydrogenase H-cluster maturation GTPase HydF [Lachnospiraceae bacterium]